MNHQNQKPSINVSFDINKEGLVCECGCDFFQVAGFKTVLIKPPIVGQPSFNMQVTKPEFSQLACSNCEKWVSAKTKMKKDL